MLEVTVHCQSILYLLLFVMNYTQYYSVVPSTTPNQTQVQCYIFLLIHVLMKHFYHFSEQRTVNAMNDSVSVE